MSCNLRHPNRVTIAAFCAQISTRAADDHETGLEPWPTGEDLCREFAVGHRQMHRRLASTVYAQTRKSLELADDERRGPRLA